MNHGRVLGAQNILDDMSLDMTAIMQYNSNFVTYEKNLELD